MPQLIWSRAQAGLQKSLKTPNGVNIPLEFRLTMGFRKRNGRWSIVHEQHSLPATD